MIDETIYVDPCMIWLAEYSHALLYCCSKVCTKPRSPTAVRNSGCATKSTTSSDTASIIEPFPTSLDYAKSFQHLIRDADGVALFWQYLKNEHIEHANILQFWFACEGLRKQQEDAKIMRLAGLIHRKFFLKYTSLIPDDVKQKVDDLVMSSKCPYPPLTLFESVQAAIGHFLATTSYLNFIKSDKYLQYVNAKNSTNNDRQIAPNNAISSLASSQLMPTFQDDIQ
ncbi:axin isoform X1 [Dendroctonus ponderosae]|uniref:axin isoform X1 n=1 Tax=Dendroctonus ponderosae TaxID=77166 RepID=UPI0020361721|nr:axin isoform X1 [Dendroctonus ponderosae]XP_019762023.2 axin isoform X1 [Dendroctonus ponderosae]KAH1025455.1 hypothetical protein HUJ05_010182 [Dendroctonus ponderosae]